MVADTLNISVMEVDRVPLYIRTEALSYLSVKEKTEPYLEELAEREARTQSMQRETMDKVLSKRAPRG